MARVRHPLLSPAVVAAALLVGAAVGAPSCASPEFPDIRSVPADLTSPNATNAKPGPGLRVVQTAPGYPSGGALYHSLYLPTDWTPGAPPPGRPAGWPVIVEMGGNGPWTSPNGDYSCGNPTCNNLGYGLSGGAGYIWLQVPYVTWGADADQGWWWGCPTPVVPNGHCTGYFSTNTTLAYLHAAVRDVLATYGGDPASVVLAGFSRGGLAVSYLGLADDATAALWAGIISYAHFDGRPSDQSVPYPDHDPASALGRLARLAPRPMYVVEEQWGANTTRAWLQTTTLPLENVTFATTGFCNHNDAWTLRPSPARVALRAWLAAVVGGAAPAS